MKIHIESFEDQAPIPAEFAFAVPDPDTHVKLSANRNPKVSWSDAPEGTQSFALIVHDPDVPSVGDDVNQEGKTVPQSLDRVDFYHWVLVDIPADRTEIAEGEDSDGVTARGKEPGKKAYGVTGINDYTGWFKGDADMEGFYGGYDGPCPPWNDTLIHRYVFTLYALDVASLGLEGNFTGHDAVHKLENHVLGCAAWSGTYTLNASL
ncbi:YbhB/YbcL family Raf kinase inhibitor-like protein [Acanthopleuribacter pedis]|uniref:YbhB/YbcL family Raf kinase inhibitor-like protein n=1 Tax=Acanthopleuribacter pedis TaxID=442870 RepID=A0A8J7U6U9_9BACT|nr:YbhB/YbcL family Raf kinase inhibitor-like protein [Acanthopleuribacter pedis]MBO1320751.1 YbhB/YbcL family Raf kinase inhibitor-like protein [Acanthopleuribacter pedis]